MSSVEVFLHDARFFLTAVKKAPGVGHQLLLIPGPLATHGIKPDVLIQKLVGIQLVLP